MIEYIQGHQKLFMGRWKMEMHADVHRFIFERNTSPAQYSTPVPKETLIQNRMSHKNLLGSSKLNYTWTRITYDFY